MITKAVFETPQHSLLMTSHVVLTFHFLTGPGVNIFDSWLFSNGRFRSTVFGRVVICAWSTATTVAEVIASRLQRLDVDLKKCYENDLIHLENILIHCKNILSTLNEMHFTNGIRIDCQVSPLVPIVPLVPMDDRNPHALIPDPFGKYSKPP